MARNSATISAETYLCVTCGTSFPAATRPPARCPICEDERQYVPQPGQAWTTRRALAQSHANTWRQLEPNLYQIHTEPQFGINERALLLCTPTGNVLWDCVALLDAATIEIVRALGGLAAIAISHPHYYTTMQDWAHAFDCPVHLHAADKAWVMRPDPALRFWEGDTLELMPGLTLLRLGGHFDGGTVLHAANAARRRGALLSGDIIQVAADTRRVSFMWSYPNMMPLPASAVRRIARALGPWPFARIYGAFPGLDVLEDGHAVVHHSAVRYAELLDGA